MTRARSTSSCATSRTLRLTATSASRATSTSPRRYVLCYTVEREVELTHPHADLHCVSIASSLCWFPTAHTVSHARRTNVTLVTGSNYQVLFVDPANTTIVYATSGTFSVEAPGSKSLLRTLNDGAMLSGLRARVAHALFPHAVAERLCPDADLASLRYSWLPYHAQHQSHALASSVSCALRVPVWLRIRIWLGCQRLWRVAQQRLVHS